jgi:hypothetical protein
MKKLRRIATYAAAPLLVLLSVMFINGPAGAWTVEATASTSCVGGQVVVNGTFTNEDTGANQGMLVSMDTKGSTPDGPKLVTPNGGSADFQIDTGQSVVPAQFYVYFSETWANGMQGSDSTQVITSGNSCPVQPTTTTTVPPVTTTTLPPTTTTTPPTTPTTVPQPQPTPVVTSPPATTTPTAPVAPVAQTPPVLVAPKTM